MMNTFKLTVLAADKPFFDGVCESLVVPTSDGDVGILAKHSNMIAAIVPGSIRITSDEKTDVAAVSEGIIKVENGEVLILVDTVERPEEIDVNRANRAIAEAKEAILQKKSIRDYYAAQARMTRAISRLKTKNYNSLTKK